MYTHTYIYINIYICIYTSIHLRYWSRGCVCIHTCIYKNRYIIALAYIYQHPLEILVSRGFVWPSKSLAHRVIPDAYVSMRQHTSLHMYTYTHMYICLYTNTYVCSTHTRVPRGKKIASSSRETLALVLRTDEQALVQI
jgi:hypothetical protein